MDASVAVDSGVDAGAVDAGDPPDAGPGDAGAPDAGTDAGVLGPAIITVTLPTAALDFGNWTCEAAPPAAQQVRVRNTGQSPGGFAVRVYDDTWFELSGASSGTLAPGGEVVFTVQPRQPTTLDPTVRNDGQRTGRFDVVALGAAIGGLTLTPQVARTGAYPLAPGFETDFGEVPLGTTRTASVTLQNLGSVAIDVTVGTSFDGPFTATLDGTALTNGQVVTLAPAAAARSLVITYAPTLAGDHRASVWFTRPAGACNATLDPLVVTGRASNAQLVVSGDLEFGETLCDGTASPRTISLTNRGGSALTWSAALALGTASPYGLAPTSGTVMPGATSTVTVTPRQTAPLHATLPAQLDDVAVINRTDVTTDPERLVALRQSVSGALLHWVDSTPLSLAALVGDTATAAWVLENGGDRPMDVTFATDAPTLLTLEPTMATVPAGGRVKVVATFSPTATMTRVLAHVRAQVGAGHCATLDSASDPSVTLTRATDLLRLGTSVVDFGRWLCSPTAAPPPAIVPVTNTSAAPVTYSIDGATTPFFEVRLPGSTASLHTLAPGATDFLEVRVVARPGDFYAHSGHFTVWSGANSYEVPVRLAQIGASLVQVSPTDPRTVTAGARFALRSAYVNRGNLPITVNLQDQVTYEVQSRTIAPGNTAYGFANPIATTGTNTYRITATVGAAALPTLCSGAPPAYAVDVTGVSTAMTTVDTSLLNFGDAPCGGTPPGWLPVVLSNPSGADVTFTTSLAANGRFTVLPTSGTVPAGSSVTLTVRPRAVTTGTPGEVTESLLIKTNTAPTATLHTIELRETIRGAILQRRSQTVSLAATGIGETSWNGAGFTIQGNVPTSLVFGRVTGDPMNEVRFAPAAGGPNPPYAALFKPAVAGTRSFDVAVSLTPGTPVCAPLPTGNTTYVGEALSTFAMRVSAGEVVFATTPCGDIPPASGFVIGNDGNAPLTYSTELETGSWFTAAPAGGTIAAGESLTVTLTSKRIPTNFTNPDDGEFFNSFWWTHTHEERVVIVAGSARVPLVVRVAARGNAYQVVNADPTYVRVRSTASITPTSTVSAYVFTTSTSGGNCPSATDLSVNFDTTRIWEPSCDMGASFIVTASIRAGAAQTCMPIGEIARVP